MDAISAWDLSDVNAPRSLCTFSRDEMKLIQEFWAGGSITLRLKKGVELWKIRAPLGLYRVSIGKSLHYCLLTPFPELTTLFTPSSEVTTTGTQFSIIYDTIAYRHDTRQPVPATHQELWQGIKSNLLYQFHSGRRVYDLKSFSRGLRLYLAVLLQKHSGHMPLSFQRMEELAIQSGFNPEDTLGSIVHPICCQFLISVEDWRTSLTDFVHVHVYPYTGSAMKVKSSQLTLLGGLNALLHADGMIYSAVLLAPAGSSPKGTPTQHFSGSGTFSDYEESEDGFDVLDDNAKETCALIEACADFVHGTCAHQHLLPGHVVLPFQTCVLESACVGDANLENMRGAIRAFADVIWNCDGQCDVGALCDRSFLEVDMTWEQVENIVKALSDNADPKVYRESVLAHTFPPLYVEEGLSQALKQAGGNRAMESIIFNCFGAVKTYYDKTRPADLRRAAIATPGGIRATQQHFVNWWANFTAQRPTGVVEDTCLTTTRSQALDDLIRGLERRRWESQDVLRTYAESFQSSRKFGTYIPFDTEKLPVFSGSEYDLKRSISRQYSGMLRSALEKETPHSLGILECEMQDNIGDSILRKCWSWWPAESCATLIA